MSSFNAQAINTDDSFTFELGLPNATNNKAYRSIMQGLVCISPSYQYALKNGISFGIGLHYSYFAINEFRVQPKIFGGIHSAATFLKLGHEKFWTERIGTEIGCKIGYLNSFAVKGINCHKPPAPTLDFALGCNADSTMAKYLISKGKLYFDNFSSNNGK